MANRAEVTKVTSYVTIGQSDVVSVPKVTAYLLLEPGEDTGGDTSSRQGHVSAQVISRSR